mgnify:CR=1 FL=1
MVLRGLSSGCVFMLFLVVSVQALDLRPTVSPFLEDGTNISMRVQRNMCVGIAAPLDALSLCTAPVASATRGLLNLSNTALSGGSAAGTYIAANPAACTGDFLNLQLAGAVRTKITCAGNVGIRTTTPVALLDVNGLASGSFFDSIALGNWNTLGFDSPGATVLALGGYRASQWNGISLHTSGAERVRITSTGNVGIGTTTFGTSAASVLAFGASTAPTTSPANITQVWADDIDGAGTFGLNIRGEVGDWYTVGNRIFRGYGLGNDTTNYERWALSATAGTGITLAAQTAGTGADNLSITLTPAGTGGLITTNTFTSTAAGALGWTVQNAMNQDCNTTCTTGACVVGIDTVVIAFLACTDGTADSCLCAG